MFLNATNQVDCKAASMFSQVKIARAIKRKVWSKRESSLERVWLPCFAREPHASVSCLEKPTRSCFAVYQTAWKSLKNINKSFFSCQKNYFHPVLEKRLPRRLQFYWPACIPVKFISRMILRMGEFLCFHPFFLFTLRQLFFATDLVFFFFPLGTRFFICQKLCSNFIQLSQSKYRKNNIRNNSGGSRFLYRIN